MRKNIILATVTLAGFSGAVLAQDPPKHTVYFGGVYAQVNSKADELVGGRPLPPPGALIDVGDGQTVGFGYVYRFRPQWSIEAALGVPPTHKGYGEGFIAPFGQISSVKQVAPTVFANYHFGSFADGRVQPFVGIGLNYTRFTDPKSTPSGDAASGGPTRIELSDSWGLAAHVGATFPIDRNWSVVGAIAYADVQSDLKATTTTFSGEIVRTTHIEFRPVVYTLAVGYSF
jgi:outer membrane protein